MQDQWTDRLDEYLDDDGELTAAERVALEAHLATCSACADLLSDLREVRARARALRDVPPSRDLWPGIAARIPEPSAAAAGTVVPLPVRSRAPRTYAFTLPQLAAAALFIVALSGALAYFARGPVAEPDRTAGHAPGAANAAATMRVANFADAQYDAAVADLQAALEAGREHLDPQTVKIVERNLALIDAAIDQARRAVEADPANPYLNNYLAEARRRKLSLLRQMSRM